jgi:hypothetical protein
MITIPYNYRQGSFQGKFGSHFDIIDMNGYHYLIVCAPNRRSNISLISVYIYSYKKREDNTFYFKHETLNREIVVPRITSLRNLSVTKNKAFHLIFDQEIITYYISSYNSNTIQISNPYPLSTNQIIKDVQSSDTNLYVLTHTEIVKYSFPNNNGSLIETDSHIEGLSALNILSFTIDSSGGIVSNSNNKIYFYDSSGTNINDFTLSENEIQSVDLFQNDPNMLILMTTNGNIYKVIQKIQLSQNISNIPISSKSKIKFHISDSSIVMVGVPESSDGNITRINLNDNTTSEISNFKNTSIQPEVIVSDDAENVYIYDRRTKIISVLLRNETNTFILSHTILPQENTSKELRFRDTILDVKINHSRFQLLIGVYPYNDNKSSIIISEVDTYLYLNKWIGNSPGYGTHIDIKSDIAVISDPYESDVTISNQNYEKGIIDLYNLKPASNFVNIVKSLRSTSQTGKRSKLSPNLNEIISIGDDNSLTMFTNIYDMDYRRVILNEKISDIEYFMEGRLIQTNKDLTDHFYRYQKVNGCFEIITKREIDIPDLTSINTKINILPLGKNYTFLYYSGGIALFDIRNMKLVQKWTETYTSNVSISIDGSTISYVNQSETGIQYIVCS